MPEVLETNAEVLPQQSSHRPLTPAPNPSYCQHLDSAVLLSRWQSRRAPDNAEHSVAWAAGTSSALQAGFMPCQARGRDSRVGSPGPSWAIARQGLGPAPLESAHRCSEVQPVQQCARWPCLSSWECAPGGSHRCSHGVSCPTGRPLVSCVSWISILSEPPGFKLLCPHAQTLMGGPVAPFGLWRKAAVSPRATPLLLTLVSLIQALTRRMVSQGLPGSG